MILKKRMIIVCLSLLFVINCASVRTKMMLQSTKPLRESIKAALNKNMDINMARDAMPSSLIQMEGMLEMAPEDTELLLEAAEAYNGYAFAFVQDTEPKRAQKLYLKARAYALRVLQQNRYFQRIDPFSNDPLVNTLNKIDRDYAPALFWSATSWLGWISLRTDDPQALADLPKVEGMLKRVLQLDEGYYHGAAHIALGSIYAARPKSLGGDPDQARIEFFKAIDISKSNYLMAYLAYAQYYATAVQDKALFLKTIDIILKAPATLSPDLMFVNQVAKYKAQRLLDDVDDYF